MWPFPAPTDVSKLIERTEKLERDFKELKLDWEMMYDKCRKLMQRIAKRAEVVENAEQKEPAGESAELAPLSGSPTWQHLTPRQKQIQMQLLARRGNGR